MDRIIHRDTEFGDLEAITKDELIELLDKKEKGFISLFNKHEYFEVKKLENEYILTKCRKKYSYNCEIGFYFRKLT